VPSRTVLYCGSVAGIRDYGEDSVDCGAVCGRPCFTNSPPYERCTPSSYTTGVTCHPDLMFCVVRCTDGESLLCLCRRRCRCRRRDGDRNREWSWYGRRRRRRTSRTRRARRRMRVYVC
jgi:hypothetical protein